MSKSVYRLPAKGYTWLWRLTAWHDLLDIFLEIEFDKWQYFWIWFVLDKFIWNYFTSLRKYLFLTFCSQKVKGEKDPCLYLPSQYCWPIELDGLILLWEIALRGRDIFHTQVNTKQISCPEGERESTSRICAIR